MIFANTDKWCFNENEIVDVYDSDDAPDFYAMLFRQ
jgi:hypothetical protein